MLYNVSHHQTPFHDFYQFRLIIVIVSWKYLYNNSGLPEVIVY
ncbi:hypothetical protein LDG_6054 [Legionella drancourtii LLAP12]|uniref:Uncharacterized protein n=1 Tax=Legionella drancourtii LLAP12 TaxID=658187 RepID=G9ELQ3_9GAMM|nr:hypothetical protein LDG_6054 [Legionella drancourtii LLAP12]